MRTNFLQVRDLLGKNQQTKLEVKERPDCGVYVKDLSTVMVHSPNEMEKLMTLGNKNSKNFQEKKTFFYFTHTLAACMIMSGFHQ